MNRTLKIISVFAISLFGSEVAAQDTLKLSVKDLFELAESKSTQIKLSKLAITEAEAKTEDLKSAKLPDLDFGVSAGYLSNVGVLGLHSSLGDGWYDMPHFSNSYSLQASYLLFAGGKVKTGINMSEIRQKLSVLDYEKSSSEIKLLLLGYYLDIYTLLQQRSVYESNIEQSKLLRQKIENRLKAGLVLKSDYVRNDILVSNYELALLKINNRIRILNHHLTEALGLPENAQVIPLKENALLTTPLEGNLDEIQNIAAENNPDNRISSVNKELAEHNLTLIKANAYPTIALFASGSFDRPFVYDLPALDIYANIFTVGIKLNYNIANLYTNRKKKNLAQVQLEEAKTAEQLSREHIKDEVHESYVNYQESLDQAATIEKEYKLAEENYRRIYNSYNEQMALITDMMDASNNKLSAGLQIEQAKTRITFNYYRLLQSTGTLK